MNIKNNFIVIFFLLTVTGFFFCNAPNKIRKPIIISNRGHRVNSALDLIPVVVATVFPNRQPTKFTANCFTNNTVHMPSFSTKGGQIEITVENPSSRTCLDLYVITTGKSFKVTPLYFKGTHKINMEWSSEEEYEIARDMGVLIFKVNHNLIDLLKEGFELYEGYQKGDIPTIKKILEERLGRKFRMREKGFVRLNWDHIKSGDFIPVFKINPTEMYIIAISGGNTGHAAMFMRDPDNPKQLYVVEAQPAWGIFMTPVEKWFETMHNGSYSGCIPSTCSAVVLPLSDDARKGFDERKAWDYLQKELMGKPYIQNGEFFSVVDSADPAAFTDPITPAFLFVSALIMERYKHDSTKTLILDGVNNRLNTNFKTFDEAVQYCDASGINILEVFAMPEKDSYRYDVPNYKEKLPALMCSSTVSRVWKASGMFDYLMEKETGIKRIAGDEDLINAQEFTPRDLVELKIFNTTSGNIFPECRGFDDLPYCQFLGQNIMDLEFQNTVPVYQHMNEKCNVMKHYPPRC